MRIHTNVILQYQKKNSCVSDFVLCETNKPTNKIEKKKTDFISYERNKKSKFNPKKRIERKK